MSANLWSESTQRAGCAGKCLISSTFLTSFHGWSITDVQAQRGSLLWDRWVTPGGFVSSEKTQWFIFMPEMNDLKGSISRSYNLSFIDTILVIPLQFSSLCSGWAEFMLWVTSMSGRSNPHFSVSESNLNLLVNFHQQFVLCVPSVFFMHRKSTWGV